MTSPPLNPSRVLAVFDFDNTLVEHDSLWPFLFYVGGPLRFVMASAALAIALLISKFQSDHPDQGSITKRFMLRHVLVGHHVDEFRSINRRLKHWCRWKPDMLAALKNHAAQGHQIVIATGSLDLYMPVLLEDLPPHDLLCTVIGVRDGVVVDDMPVGNCVRARKAELVADYIAAHGPYDDSWGYGNYPYDVPMLMLMNKRIIV